MSDSKISRPQQTGPYRMMSITSKEFNLIRCLVYDRFGINLTDQKRSLVVGRLQKLLRIKGFSSFQAYYDYVISDKSDQALVELVNKITTRHTYFNREKVHFDFLIHTALPELIARLKQYRSNDIRIWCAGCSTGEEAYMLVMLMQEYFKEEYKMWNAGILATDISRDAIAEATAGVYTNDKVRMIPENFKRNYFSNLGNGKWSVKDQVKKEVTFRRFNLMNKQFPFKKKFHVIFCRNVMIYFDLKTRESLIDRFCQSTDAAGYLFIGHSETLGRQQTMYKYIMPAVYKKLG